MPVRLDHITPKGFAQANRRDCDRIDDISVSMIHIASREATSLETQASQDATVSPDDHSEREPPDPMPNSEVKPLSADGSVEFLHVRVGHRQALILNRPCSLAAGAVLFVRRKKGCAGKVVLRKSRVRRESCTRQKLH